MGASAHWTWLWIWNFGSGWRASHPANYLYSNCDRKILHPLVASTTRERALWPNIPKVPNILSLPKVLTTLPDLDAHDEIHRVTLQVTQMRLFISGSHLFLNDPVYLVRNRDRGNYLGN